VINGTETGSPSQMTVSAYSPDSYVSTMTDFFEPKSSGTGDMCAPPEEMDQDPYLFSPCPSDHSRTDTRRTQDDIPDVTALQTTQSTVRNASQRDTLDPTASTLSDL
jgi:hypothetical protein